MKDCRIYLSGSMSGVSFEEQSQWRKQIQNAIKFNYDYEKKVSFFNPIQYFNFEEKRHSSELEIMNFDLNALRKSDLIVVNFNNPSSIGTAMEMMLGYEMRIPILGLNKENKEIHPWLECCCDRIFSNMRDLVEYVVDFYLN